MVNAFYAQYVAACCRSVNRTTVGIGARVDQRAIRAPFGGGSL